MQLFIDTANIDEIREVSSWGIISGVTTNPKIIFKEKGKNFKKIILEILGLVDGPVSVEVTTNDLKEMIEEARRYSRWHKNIVVKIPMGIDGLKAVNLLSREQIKTNVTAIMSINQAILAALAGATYASIFVSRIGDIGHEGVDVVRDTVKLFDQHKFKTKVIVGSTRHLMDINRAALAGAHIITVPTPFLIQMAHHPRTVETINEFLKMWEEFKKAEPGD